MTLFQRLATLAILSLCGCGGGNDDGVKSPLSSASAAALAVVQAPPPAPVAPAAPPAPPVKVTALALPAMTPTAVGSLTPMAVQATNASGAAVPATALVWESADPTLATVDEGGVVKPLRVGFTTIKVSADGVSASGTVSVRGTTSIPARSRHVGMNLAGIAYYSTEFPFADMMKSGMGWTSREDNGTWGKPFPSLTADGYPAALAPGQHALNAVAWDGSRFAPGRYVVLWDGDGSISFPMSNVKIAETAANRIAIDVVDTSGSLWVAIDRTSASNPVRNLRFLWPGTEATYASQPFNPVFLAKVAPFSVLRFIDWGATNTTPVVEWAQRSHVADVTYATPAGVPIEVMIDLANTLHVDPWFCIPHQASDDYVRQFATLLRGRLDPALRPHIEYSNEVWNTGFGQTQWAIARSQALGLDIPFGQPAIFYAMRSVQMFKIVQDVVGSRPRPHRARDRRPGGVGQLPRPRARVPGHRRQRRRDGDRAVLQRCRSRRPGPGSDDAHPDQRSDRRPDARPHPRRHQVVDDGERGVGREVQAEAEGLRERGRRQQLLLPGRQDRRDDRALHGGAQQPAHAQRLHRVLHPVGRRRRRHA